MDCVIFHILNGSILLMLHIYMGDMCNGKMRHRDEDGYGDRGGARNQDKNKDRDRYVSNCKDLKSILKVSVYPYVKTQSIRRKTGVPGQTAFYQAVRLNSVTVRLNLLNLNIIMYNYQS